MKCLADIGQSIEKRRVLTAEMYRNDVAMCLYTLGDECLSPRQVVNSAALFTTAQPCGKYQNVVLTVESRLDIAGKLRLCKPVLLMGMHKGAAQASSSTDH